MAVHRYEAVLKNYKTTLKFKQIRNDRVYKINYGNEFLHVKQ